MWLLKTTTVPVIVGALGMIKKRQINTWTIYLAIPNYMKYKKLYEPKMFKSEEEYYQSDWKISHRTKKKRQYILPPTSLTISFV